MISTMNSAEFGSKNGSGIKVRKIRRTPILKAILPIDGSMERYNGAPLIKGLRVCRVTYT